MYAWYSMRVYSVMFVPALQSFFADRIGLGSWPNIMRTSLDAIAYVITKRPPEGMNVSLDLFF